MLMETIYIKEDREDNTIILRKVNINFSDYDIIQEEDIITLKPKKILKIINLLNTDELRNYSFTKSIITDCTINNKHPTDNKYYRIVMDIYTLINDSDLIYKNCILNKKIKKQTDHGFNYLEKYEFSIQSADANKTLKEIVTQCICNNIKLNIEIKL